MVTGISSGVFANTGKPIVLFKSTNVPSVAITFGWKITKVLSVGCSCTVKYCSTNSLNDNSFGKGNKKFKIF